MLLSLEMHCSVKQQKIVAESLISHLGERLLTYDELLNKGGWPSRISPQALAGRVLVKGKIKPLKRAKAKRNSIGEVGRTLTRQVTKAGTTAARNLSQTEEQAARCVSTLRLRTFGLIALSRRQSGRGQSAAASEGEGVLDEETVGAEESSMAPEGSASNGAIAKGTHELLAEVTTLRSQSVESHLEADESKWPLPIASIGEDVLLKRMGLGLEERNEIEGLTRATHGAVEDEEPSTPRKRSTRSSGSSTRSSYRRNLASVSVGSARLVHEKATTGLARDPPPATFVLQARIATTVAAVAVTVPWQWRTANGGQ